MTSPPPDLPPALAEDRPPQAVRIARLVTRIGIAFIGDLVVVDLLAAEAAHDLHEAAQHLVVALELRVRRHHRRLAVGSTAEDDDLLDHLVGDRVLPDRVYERPRLR